MAPIRKGAVEMASQQPRGTLESEQGKKGQGDSELPMESSPYVKYTDLEDYKRQGYGTEGHEQVVDRQPGGGGGGGGTEGPTMSGSGIAPGLVLAAEAATNIAGAAQK